MDARVKSEYSPLAIRQSRLSGPQWRPNVHNFPWIGGISIIAMVSCVAGCVAIIALSDNQPVVDWKFQPAVLLAVLSSITNLSTAASFSQGASIAWWRSALHGTHLKGLHQIWSFGKGEFLSTRKWSKDSYKMALVALMTTIAVVTSNPLLQRATHVRNGYKTGDVDMRIDLMQDPLEQAYGLIQYGIPSNTLLYTNFLGSIQGWYSKTPISTSTRRGYYCNGTCEGVVISPGIDSNCSSTTRYLNLTDLDNNGALLFSINFTRFQSSFDETVLGLEVSYSTDVDSDCIATIKSDQCNISTAMVRRPIQIDTQALSLDRKKASSLISRVSSYYDSIYALEGSYAGPLDVLDYLGQFYFVSSFTLDLQPSIPVPAVTAHGIVAAGENYQITNVGSTKECYYTWRRPTNDILDAMEEVLFRMALHPGVNFYPAKTQTFSAHQVTPTLVFHSNYRYLACAVTIMVLALLSILIPLWGWWELPRPVSLSPVETAKAFGAPLLQNDIQRVNVGDLLNEVGHVQVRYDGFKIWHHDPGATASGSPMDHIENVGTALKNEKFETRTDSELISYSHCGKDAARIVVLTE